MAERSKMRGTIKRQGVTYVFDLTADAYVPLKRTGPLDPTHDAGTFPEALTESGKPDPKLGVVTPDELDKALSKVLYGDSNTPLRRRNGL